MENSSTLLHSSKFSLYTLMHMDTDGKIIRQHCLQISLRVMKSFFASQSWKKGTIVSKSYCLSAQRLIMIVFCKKSSRKKVHRSSLMFLKPRCGTINLTHMVSLQSLWLNLAIKKHPSTIKEVRVLKISLIDQNLYLIRFCLHLF